MFGILNATRDDAFDLDFRTIFCVQIFLIIAVFATLAFVYLVER